MLTGFFMLLTLKWIIEKHVWGEWYLITFFIKCVFQVIITWCQIITNEIIIMNVGITIPQGPLFSSQFNSNGLKAFSRSSIMSRFKVTHQFFSDRHEIISLLSSMWLKENAALLHKVYNQSVIGSPLQNSSYLSTRGIHRLWKLQWHIEHMIYLLNWQFCGYINYIT